MGFTWDTKPHPPDPTPFTTVSLVALSSTNRSLSLASDNDRLQYRWQMGNSVPCTGYLDRLLPSLALHERRQDRNPGAECRSDRRGRLQFGVRSISFNSSHGFVINGVETKLYGGCVHHDHGALGAMAIDRAEERRVQVPPAHCDLLRLSARHADFVQSLQLSVVIYY